MLLAAMRLPELNSKSRGLRDRSPVSSPVSQLPPPSTAPSQSRGVGHASDSCDGCASFAAIAAS
jgi:hypothetical protein